MNFKAIILFLSLNVYLGELLALPAWCFGCPVTGTECATRTVSTCSGKDSKARNCCQGTKDEGCKKAVECNFNCPLNYITTITPSAQLSYREYQPVKNEYGTVTSRYSFLYNSSAWKPPDGC